MIRQEASSFIKENSLAPIIDVRSPSEYNQGHISGAINIPLFTDDERAIVGTIYKNNGKEAAIEKGLEFVGPKMKDLGTEAKSNSRNGTVRVYCWRGGMRSEKMAWLFELVGLNAYVLEGGYQAFRTHLLESFKNIPKLLVLQGPTGSGKTDILNALENKDEQVIDLEGLANHKGSAFGHIGLAEQPTTQQFQNDVFNVFKNFDVNQRIWIESESLTIGKVYLPETLWDQMNDTFIIQLEIPKKLRIDRLVRDYGTFDISKLIASTEKIQRKFGGDKVRTVKGYIEEGNLAAAADLLLDYYDKSYMHSQKVYKKKTPILTNIISNNSEQNADILIDVAIKNGI